MQSERLISCLLLLQGKRCITARELSGHLAVTMRTVYRFEVRVEELVRIWEARPVGKGNP